MNTFTMTQKTVSARFLAVLTMVSMILSAFPVAFFVADAAVSTSIFSDSFETEPAFSSPAWSNDPKWSTSATNAHTGTRKAKTEGNTGAGAVLETAIDATGYESISLSFWYRLTGFEANDNDRIEVDWHDGTDWNPLVTLDGADVSEWTEWSGSLGTDADDNSDIKIRFTAHLDAGNDKFYLDDVNLTGVELVDVCENIDGYQEVVPDGYELTDNGCYPEAQPLEQLGFTSICRVEDGGLRFRVQNTNDVPVSITYEVVGTDPLDTGVVAVAAAGSGVIKYEGATDGADYTFFDTVETTGPGTTKISYDDGTGNTVTLTKAANDDACPLPPEPEAPITCSYEGIAEAVQGDKNDTTPVDANRSLTSAVENGVASYANFFGKEGNDWQVNPLDFYSLGIGGELVYEFTDKIAVDQSGADIAIWEITGGNAAEQSDESVKVYLSANGIDYELAGTVTGDGTVDIANTSLDFVKFVKLVDQSAGTQGPTGDGYDLDAITIIDGSCDDFATVHTTKIVCDLESELPNLGGNSGPTITSDFAATWLADNQDTSCRLVEDWEFEWGAKTASNPGNSYVGYGGSAWTTFVDSVAVPSSVLADKSFWVREVLPADYIPFTGGKNNNVSAELYCHVDGLNYDNFDRIDKPEAGEDYYCVAWNVPVEKTSEVTMCKYDQDLNPLEGWQLALLGDSVDDIAVKTIDGSTQSLANVPKGDYVLKAEGTYNYGNGNRFADARFSERKPGESNYAGPYLPWVVASDTTGGLAVQVNDDLGELWGDVFSPAHTYYGSLTQSVLSNVNFKIWDNNYSDNVGGINVSLYAGRTGITGADGCVTFTEVPYGDYEIEELLQGGWTNVSGLGQVEVNDETEKFDVKNTDFVQAPYCGDDDKNQGWEQCDGGSDCTDYCTLANQCSAEQLIKITLDPTESTSFDGSIHLGAEGNTVPNGTWFNFNEVGDDSFVSTANATEGLAVERNQTDNTLTLAFVGGNGTKKLDIVAGTIMTKGINLGSVNREPNPQFKLEDGSGNSFDDVFNKNLDQSIDFDLRADTGNDGVSVVIEVGDEYDCPECKATVEARVVLDSNGQAGNGDLNGRVILGDALYTTVEFGEWFPISVIEPGDTSATMISDPNTVTNFASPKDKAGLFVSREGGTVKVALYGKHNPGGNVNHEWIDARIEIRDAEITNFSNLTGDFKLENHSETDSVPSNDGSDTAVADDTGVDFRLWVDTQSDGFRFNIDHDSIASCEEDTSSSLVITDTDTNGEVLSGTYTFKADYQDEDDNEDEVFWAIRAGSCNGADVVGNAPASPVPNNPSTFNPLTGEFETTVDMSTWANGDYCLVVNPREDAGAKPLRETRTFTLQNLIISEPETTRIDGFKYEQADEQSTPVLAGGWMIFATNGIDTTLSTTTDANGYYYFDVADGEWEIYEEKREDWEQLGVMSSQYLVVSSEDEVVIPDSCRFTIGGSYIDTFQTALLSRVSDSISIDRGDYWCDFLNTPTEEIEEPEPENPSTNNRSSSRSSGTRIERALPAPLVAGAATVNMCPFLTQFMQIGIDNDETEVMKLQMFLNIFKGIFGGTENPITGEFDTTTDANVKAFQENFRVEVLDPWYERGIVPHNRPTGFVYKTTLWKINSIVCPDSAITPDFAGEDLTKNINID